MLHANVHPCTINKWIKICDCLLSCFRQNTVIPDAESSQDTEENLQPKIEPTGKWKGLPLLKGTGVVWCAFNLAFNEGKYRIVDS